MAGVGSAGESMYMEKINVGSGLSQSFPNVGFFDPQRDQFDIMVFTNGGLDLELLPNYQPHCPNTFW